MKHVRGVITYLGLGACLAWLSAAFAGYAGDRLSERYWQIAKFGVSEWPGPVPSDWKSQASRDGLQVTWSIARSHVLMQVINQRGRGRKEYERYIFGFPFPSFLMDRTTSYPRLEDLGSFNLVNVPGRGGIQFRDPFEESGGSLLPNPFDPYTSSVVPLFPWWPGFILNTIFWSLVAAWIARLFRFARWGKYLSRGQCPKCKYPIGAKPVCPECGIAVPGGLARPAGEVP